MSFTVYQQIRERERLRASICSLTVKCFAISAAFTFKWTLCGRIGLQFSFWRSQMLVLMQNVLSELGRGSKMQKRNHTGFGILYWLCVIWSIGENGDWCGCPGSRPRLHYQALCHWYWMVGAAGSSFDHLRHLELKWCASANCCTVNCIYFTNWQMDYRRWKVPGLVSQRLANFNSIDVGNRNIIQESKSF